MADIFISYSKVDRQVAQALAAELQAHGYNVWWDFELYAGEDFHEVILAELDRAKAVIVIWSDPAVGSRWVRGEAEHAAKQSKLVPTHVRGFDTTRIPLNFKAFHTESLDNRTRILRAVERLGVRPVRAAPPPPQPFLPAQRYGRSTPSLKPTQPGHVERPDRLATPAEIARRFQKDDFSLDIGRSRRAPNLYLTGTIVALIASLGIWVAYTYVVKPAEHIDARATPSKEAEGSALKGVSGPPEAIDARLQATRLWRVVKQEFPDWYAERLKEAAELSAQSKDQAEIAQHLARALVGLRRQNGKHALAADVPHLKSIAVTFYENLAQLRKHSSEACFALISQGEASPVIVSLMQNPAHAAHLQAQLTAVFEAIADGRKKVRTYPEPRRADYDALKTHIVKLGWSEADLQLFTDAGALARASPEKVCQLVHDWFAAHFAIKDPDMQLRLLVETVKPVVGG